MIAHKYTVALAMIAALAIQAEAGPLASGVCYSPWHHGSVNEGVLQKDYGQIKQHFTSIRTFHARFSGVNVVDSCAKAGLRVSVGIMMKDRGEIEKEIQAACDGAKRNPGIVDSIMVGNENMKNGYHGDISAGELVEYINKVKGCTAGTSIKVGTVQRINEWLSAPGAQDVAGVSDVVGVNIYPFFTPGPKSPMEKFLDQYKQMSVKFPENKIRITETGWPRNGSPSPAGQAPSKETAQAYFTEYSKWAESHPQSYYFMMYDTTNAYGGGDFETSFGLFDKGAQQQITIPSGNGPAPGPAPSDNPYTPAPTTKSPDTPAPTTKSPETPAPTNNPYTPAPTTKSPETPAPTTKSPETPAPTHNPYTPAPTTKSPETPAPTTKSPQTPAPTHNPYTPAPTTAKPSTPATTTPCPPGQTPAPTTQAPAPAPTTQAPAPTPAASKPHHKHHHNSTKQVEVGGEGAYHAKC